MKLRLKTLICVTVALYGTQAMALPPTRTEEPPSLAPPIDAEAVTPAPGDPGAPGPEDEFPQTAPLMTSEPTPPEGTVAAPEPAPEATTLAEPSPEPTETPVAAESEPTPAPAPEAAPPTATESVADIDPRIPRRTLERPQFAFEITTSLKALGSQPRPAEFGSEARIRGVSVQLEYQPKFLQAIGVLGVGPSASLYPVTGTGGMSPRSDLTRPVTGIWSVGGQLRYQLRLFREQLIVPMTGYAVESVSYSLRLSGNNGRLLAQGPFFGAMLLLNPFEPSAAGEFYAGHGVTRSYLVAELRQLSGSDDTFDVSGSSLYFGLRFEF